MSELNEKTTDETAQENSALSLALKIVKIADGRLADDIRVFHVTDKTVITDYFVMCTGNGSTHVRGICDEVEFRLSEEGVKPARTEGLDGPMNWAVLDFSSVIFHVFNTETRKFYNLERLWSEAEEIDVSSYISAR